MFPGVTAEEGYSFLPSLGAFHSIFWYQESSTTGTKLSGQI